MYFYFLKEIIFVNTSYLFPRVQEDRSNRGITSTHHKIIILACFLPIYIVSALFRITTFVILFTYLNVWAFCPMIISWILNISSVQRTKTTSNTRSSNMSSNYTSSLLNATLSVFIPLCKDEHLSGN